MRSFTLLLAPVAFVFMSLLPLSAQESPVSDSDLEILLAMNPGMTREEILDFARIRANELNRPQKQVLKELANDARRAAGPSSPTDIPSERAAVGTRQLSTSYCKGDIYLTPAYTAGVNYGHVGIYGGTNWVVEAKGQGYLSNWYWHWQVDVLPGTELMETTYSQAV